MPRDSGNLPPGVVEASRAFYADDCCILNTGPGVWAFAEHAAMLSQAMGLAISETPRRFNYVLGYDDDSQQDRIVSFVPWRSIDQAGDKRLLAETFASAGVATPLTRLIDSPDEVWRAVERDCSREWCLKYPIGCGAAGHRLIASRSSIPEDWPRPYILQEFIRLANPEVYRLYSAGGNTFGWNVRRFPAGTRSSPWVAHARGARYAPTGAVPSQAVVQATAALVATSLLDSFGCADLLQRPTGEWLVLEVGTDGVNNHVDRAVDDPALIGETNRRLSDAFWNWVAMLAAS